MSKRRSKDSDDLRDEYDFSTMAGGVRGKYVKRYRAGTNIALLERDVAAAFPTDDAVNEALRAVIKAASRIPRSARLASRRSPPAGRRAAHR